MNFNDPYENSPNINNVYIVENIPTKETEEQFQEIFTEGCECEDVCTLENNCYCLQKYGLSYNILKNEDDSFEDACKNMNYSLDKNKFKYGLYECNSSCKCVNKACGNRYVQYGPREHLDIRDCDKGKGLYTTEKILKGNFVCEYAGEIITKNEALKRFKYNEENKMMNYILCVREHFGSKEVTIFIDPSYMGNIGRFANHSCNPNCELIPVRVNNAVPKLCIFAKRDIEADSELTFSYGENTAPNKKIKLKPCLCGEETCRKWLPYFPEICE